MSGLKRQKKKFWFSKKRIIQKKNHRMTPNMMYLTSMGGVKPDPYVIPGVVTELMENIEVLIDEFLENAVIDELNSGAFLDEYIDHVIELGRNDLKQQAYEHHHIIEGIQSAERGELLICLSRQREIMKRIEGEKRNSKEAEENGEAPKHIYKEIIA